MSRTYSAILQVISRYIILWTLMLIQEVWILILPARTLIQVAKNKTKVKLKVCNYNICKKEIKMCLQLVTAQSGVLCRSAASICRSGSCRIVHVSTFRVCQFWEFLEDEVLARALTYCLGRNFVIVVPQRRQKLSRDNSLKRISLNQHVILPHCKRLLAIFSTLSND